MKKNTDGLSLAISDGVNERVNQVFKCVHHQFEAQVAASPEAVAVIYEGEALSYNALNARANQLAHYLIQECSITPGALVGISLKRSIDMVVSILGVLKAGAAYVPLDPDYPVARLTHMMEEAELSTILSVTDIVATLSVGTDKVVCFDDELTQSLLTQQETQNPNLTVSSSDLVYVIYTSGSTGKPKGVMLEHGALENRITWMHKHYGCDANDKVLQKTPYSFDVSVWEFLWPLTVGAQLVLAKPQGHKEPKYLCDLIEEAQITKLHFVPSMLNNILNYGRLGLCKSLKQVFCSGEALMPKHVETFYTQCPNVELHNLYGPTEAAIDVTYWDCRQYSEKEKKVFIGKAISNIQLYILDSEGQKVDEGVAGELHIGGVGLARGYIKRPDLTAEKFITNPFIGERNNSPRLYKTGDLVRRLHDGQIEYLGRIDEQVKVRGFRIELAEIEHSIMQSDLVRQCVVQVRLSNAGEQILVAFVELHQGTPSSNWQNNIKQLVAELLPEFMHPSSYQLLSEFPLTNNGKVDRKQISLMTVEAPSILNYVAPRTELESQLCGLWQQILKVPLVGINNTFLELHGNSLLATRVVSEINERWECGCQLKDLFDCHDVEKLAEQVEFLIARASSEQQDNTDTLEQLEW